MGRLSLHALAYGLILALVTVLVPLGASFGSDDGAYGGQVWALRHGGWALDRPVPVVAEANEGWLNTSITADGPTPYTANPTYSRLLQAAVRLVHGPAPGGDTAADTAADLSLGLHLPGVVAALVAACLAWQLAARWDRRAGPVAFWLLGLGPILVDTTALWAHPLSTATAGAATLAAVRLLPAPGPDPGSDPGSDANDLGPHPLAATAWRGLLVVGLAAGAALRSEALFFTAGLLVAVMLVDRSRAMVATVTAAGGLALAVAAVNRTWGMRLRAGRLPVETNVAVLEGHAGWAASRIPAAWQLLVTGLGPSIGTLLVLVALGATVVAGLSLGRNAGPLTPVLLLALAAGAHLAKAVIEPGQLISGLAAAWPVVPLALVAGRARGRSPLTHPNPGGRAPGPSWLLVPAGGLLAAVLVTQYAASGGLQWGGRYLSMAYVPLAAAAALPLTALFPTLFTTAPARGRRVLPAALAALVVAPALSGVVASHRLHTTHASVVARVTERPAEVVITDIPALPRIAWTALPVAFYRADADTIGPLLAQLAAAGVATVNVQGSAGADLDGMAGYRLVSTDGPVRHLTLDAALELRPSPAVPAADP